MQEEIGIRSNKSTSLKLVFGVVHLIKAFFLELHEAAARGYCISSLASDLAQGPKTPKSAIR